MSAQNAEGRSLHAVPEVATEKLTIAQSWDQIMKLTDRRLKID